MRKKALKDKQVALDNYFTTNKDIATVILFGSFGTPLYDPSHSDIDLAIIYYCDLPLKTEMLISAELSVIFEKDDLDVVNLNKTRVDICHQILATGEIIYEEDKLVTADFVEKTLKHYFDYGIPLYNMKVDFIETVKEESTARDRQR